MCKEMEDMRTEAVKADRIKSATEMLKDGLDDQLVAKYSGLTLEQVGNLSRELSRIPGVILSH